MNDPFLTVFTEALVHRLLPLLKETTLEAIRQFNPADYPAHAMFAGVGALIASAALYAIGIWLRRLPAKVSTERQQERIKRMQVAARDWLPWLLILSPSPVGGMLIIAAGFFAIRPLVAALAIFAAEVLWRVSPVI